MREEIKDVFNMRGGENFNIKNSANNGIVMW